MKYVISLDDYILLENENDGEKVNKSQVATFFKKNWKAIAISLGLSATGIIAYFLYRDKPISGSVGSSSPGISMSDVIKKPIVQDDVDITSTKISSVMGSFKHKDLIPKYIKHKEDGHRNIEFMKKLINSMKRSQQTNTSTVNTDNAKKIINTLNIPNELKTELNSPKYNAATLTLISEMLIDMEKVKGELDEYSPEILNDIVDKSDKESIVNNIVTAIQLDQLKWHQVPQILIKKVRSAYDDRKGKMTDEIWNERVKSMESLGIYYDELDDKMFKVEKAGLRSAYHESFLTSLKKVMEIKNIRGIFWNKKLTTRKSREEIIKQKGFCRDDFDGRTYDWLILPNKATEREFWNYLQDKADKFKEEKEKLWIEKKNILIKVGFNPDDFITDPLIKYLDMKNFKDYIKSTSELLDKGVEKSLHNKLYAEIERIDKEEAKRKKDEEKTFNYH